MPKLELVPRIDQELSTATAVVSSGGGGGGGGVTDHGALTGLADDDHTQYLHTSINRTTSAIITFAPSSTNAPFVIGTNAQGQLVSDLNADQLDGYEASEFTLLTTFNAHAIGNPNAHHDAVTLTAAADVLLDIETSPDQQVDIADFPANSFLAGPTSGGAASPTIRTLVEADIPAHNIVGSLHTITGAEFSVVGATATDTLGLLTPSSNPGATDALLKTDANGHIILDGVGIGADPSTTPLKITSTVQPQFTIEHSSGNTADYAVDSSGNLTVTVDSGNFLFDPSDNFVMPSNNYDLTLGGPANVWLALHAAELRVGTLVAAEELATFNGRWLVGEASNLIADVGVSDITIDVKHNFFTTNDIIYLDSGGSFEAIEIDSTATTISGGYRYNVTRDVDGSGANSWNTADVTFSTGQANDGYIEAYAEQSRVGSTTGPTMVGWFRTTTGGWPNIEPRWAVGNLNGLYGFSSNDFGFAAGDPNGTFASVDASSGMRIVEDSTTKFRVYGSDTGSGGTTGQLRIGTDTDTQAGVAMTVFPDADSDYFGESVAAGDIIIGSTDTDDTNLFFDQSEGRLKFRVAQSEILSLSSNGISIPAPTGDATFLSQTWAWVSDDVSTNAIIHSDTAGNFNLNITNTSQAANQNSNLNLISRVDNTGDSSRITLSTTYDPDTTLNTNIYMRSSTDLADDSKIILTGGSGFDGVLIGASQVATDDPDALLDVVPAANGEGIKSDNAFMGRGSFGSSWAQFSHWSHRNSGSQYGIIHNSNGQLILTSTDISGSGQLRIDNTERLRWTDDEIRANTDNSSGSGFNVRDIAFMGVGANGTGFATYAHYSQATGTTSYALMQQSTGQTFVNSASGTNLNLRVASADKMVITGSDITAKVALTTESQLNAESDLTIDGDLKVNRSGSDRTGYIYVPLTTATNISGWNNRLFTDAAGANEHGANDDGTGTFTPSNMGTIAAAKAVEMRVVTAYEKYEEGTGHQDWSGKDGYIILGPSTDRTDLASRFLVEGTFSTGGGTPTSGFHESAGIVRTDGSGNVSWQVVVPADTVSGLNWTEYYIHVYVWVTGYFV